MESMSAFRASTVDAWIKRDTMLAHMSKNQDIVLLSMSKGMPNPSLRHGGFVLFHFVDRSKRKLTRYIGGR